LACLLRGSRNVNRNVVETDKLSAEKESMGNSAKESFNLRAFASVFAGLSFVLMAVTGLVLFFAPSCRIARDTSWAVWGHDKEQWVAVHVWLSIACITASLIHIYLNWTALTNYFKDKVRKGLAFVSSGLPLLLSVWFSTPGPSAGWRPSRR
jgi:cytochrome b subunit of formate dehydrogenase